MKKDKSLYCFLIFSFLSLSIQAEIKTVRLAPDTLMVDLISGEGPSDFVTGESNPKQTLIAHSYESLFITCDPGTFQIQEIRRETETLQEGAILVEDIPLSGSEIEDDYVQLKNQNTKDAVQRQVLGLIGNKEISDLKIFRYIQYPGSALFRLKEFQVKIIGTNIRIIESILERSQTLAELAKNRQIDGNGVSPVLLKPSDSNPKSPRLKIRIKNEGLYMIPQTLVKKAGWDVTGIHPRYFRIRNAEGEIPIRITGEEDGSFDMTDVIEFWGEPLWDRSVPGEKRLDVFATQNIYWLETGEKPGLRMGQEEGWVSKTGPQTSITSRFYLYRQHEEKNDVFNRLPYSTDVENGDYWFYSSPIMGMEKRQIGFRLVLPDPYATQYAKIWIKLRGQSLSLAAQSVEAYINDKWVASGTWRGSESVLLESQDISPKVLTESNNILTLVNRSADQELAPLLLDWFEISYARLYKADGNYIRFRAPQNSAGKVCRFQIEGFSDRNVDVYKIGTSKIIGGEVVTVTDTLGRVSQTLRFDDEIVDESTEYVALSPVKKLLPDSVEWIRGLSLRSKNRGADYIAIVSSDSLGEKSIEALIKHRESQGFKCAVIRLDSIYNEFNEGIPNPTAIRRFLQYAKQQWDPSPRWVLLVGDGSIDNRLPPEKGNVIPTPFVQTTKYGATVSDYWYALLDGDDISDLAIGRLPVRNRFELKAVLDKIIEYDKSPPAPWKNKYLMIGADYVGATLFRDQSETFIREFNSPKLDPKRLYVWGKLFDPSVGDTKTLLNHFQQGVGLINFRGHGGGAIWADANLLGLEEVKDIQNKGKLPVITSMTCFTGDFTGGRYCLGEALLNLEQNGAVAFWGSSGTGWTWADYYMLKELVQLIDAEPNLTLGEMIQKAKFLYLSTNPGELGISEVHQYNLLGDPAIKFTFPEKTTSFTIKNRSLSVTDSLRIEGTASTPASQLLLEWTGRDRAALSSSTGNLSQKGWRASLSAPQNFRETAAGVRVYLWDEKSGSHENGYLSFSVGRSFFDSLRTLPENPTSRDSILFTVKVQDPAGVRRIWCKVLSPKPDSIPAMPMAGSNGYITSRWYSRSLPGARLSYFFLSENANGTLSRSDTLIYFISTLPDLAVQTLALGGADRVVLVSSIYNFGKESVPMVRIKFECPEIGFEKMDTLAVGGNEYALAKVPFPAYRGPITCIVTVNPDSGLIESSYRNNQLGDRFTVNRFNVTPENGSIGINASGQVGLPGKIQGLIPSGALPKPSVFLIEEIRDLDAVNTVSGTLSGYRLSLPGLLSPQSISKEMTLWFYPPLADSARTYKPYRYDNSINRWLLCDYSQSDTAIVVRTKYLGLYRLNTSNDLEAPRLELQVDQQPFSSGSYVSKNPHFSLVIQDSSGVDIRSEKIQIVLDNFKQESAGLSYPDSSKNPNHVVVSFYPDLTPGNHTLMAKAVDVHGNWGQTETFSFSVSESFTIQYLGNHPNPFRRETVFVYILTDAAERVSLKIYTVSGRRIRIFEEGQMASPDYHEVEWDGKDEWGEDISNGVYFFRLSAETGGVQKEITGKIAKLR